MQHPAVWHSLLHADTNLVSVHGNYEQIEGIPAIQIYYVHTKDNRPALIQFVLKAITN